MAFCQVFSPLSSEKNAFFHVVSRSFHAKKKASLRQPFDQTAAGNLPGLFFTENDPENQSSFPFVERVPWILGSNPAALSSALAKPLKIPSKRWWFSPAQI